MAHSFDDEDEAPLDPAVARVQTRLRRLILVSGLTLGLGIFAVFGAIVYRIVAADTSAPATVPQLSLSEMGLPADARLIAANVDGDRLVLTYVHAGGNTIVLIDAETLEVVGTLAVEGR